MPRHEKSKNTFIAKVDYTIPVMDELRRRFPALVNEAYKNIKFKPIQVCENRCRETREVEFELVHLGHDTSTEAALIEIHKRGLLPALPEELLAFDAKYVMEMIAFPIAALGAETILEGCYQVAYLWCHHLFGRSLNLNTTNGNWGDDFKFLAVRE